MNDPDSYGTKERHERAKEANETVRLGYRHAKEYVAKHAIIDDTLLIDKLKKQDIIDDEMARAGEEFYKLYLKSNLEPRTAFSYNPLSSGPAELSEAEDVYRRKYREILNYLGPLADLAQDVCCHQRARDEIDRIRLAMGMLAVFYGYKRAW